MTDHDLPTRTEGEGETLDMPEGMETFAPGQVLGERYQILEMLGRGGMGEVWHAFDLKLRVEVALKALREDLFKSERRLEMLRDEVRAAREVVSPNVCRIFDLIEIDGRELVSMEYVDGATLLGVLQERGPLELKEAQDIASQFLAGLEAIHKVGLVHRDIKPENIMLTRAGRVVVMDFGLARQETEGGGSVAGTPAYMSPEQAAGQTLDPRADVYSAGVVLAEMVSPEGIADLGSRQSVWEGVRSEPANVPDTPWADVIQKAVARDREHRFNTAHTLTRALEDVTLRVEGAEDLHPYPGLASFTEEDAEYFFGREAEVEQVWRKLEGPPRMLAIMGPSGAGKSSFIGAGLTPNAPPNWTIIRCTPGSAAIPSLRGALTSELTGGSEALQSLVTDPDNPDVIVDAVVSWRTDHHCALLIVDQFEELFTLNSKDEQRRYAALLGRLPLEADVHVVLSMRDDFAAACDTHEAFRPVFHELSVLHPPAGANLRRALAQPATKCGYRFEDDDFVEEILAEVEGERGALPLLAFALAQLWEKRDREAGLLTREAYHDIGGVGGALARHAEATIDRIGADRISIVRELFRNLVTAEGTRAVREWGELLSVFDKTDVSREGINPSPTKEMWPSEKQNVGAGFTPAHETAENVLMQLIDARLLTSYEVREEDEEPTRKVEIIHESLLANWPRLVRWQTQDQEGAQLRDELRQSSRAWDEHGRHNDRLWTGTAFREYEVWRDRYPGGLTDLEEAFGSAMTSFAGRRRQRRRIAVATVIAILLAGLAVVGSFWQKSVREARRAEAANLLSLGQLELDKNPTATLAYAITSLDMSDNPGARHLALDALWKGPTAFIVSEEGSWQGNFTPDGRWLVQSIKDTSANHLRVFAADGSAELLEQAHESTWVYNWMGAESDVFYSFNTRMGSSHIRFVLWSMPEKRRLAEALYENLVLAFPRAISFRDGRLVLFVVWDGDGSVDALSFDGVHERLGTLGFDFRSDVEEKRRVLKAMDELNGRWLGLMVGNEVFVVEIGDHSLSEPRRLGRQEGTPALIAFDPRGRFFATANEEGQIQLWNPEGDELPTILEGPVGMGRLKITPDGSLLKAWVQDAESDLETWFWSVDGDEPHLLRRFDLGTDGGYDTVDLVGRRFVVAGRNIRLWNFGGPADAEPLTLLRGDNGGNLRPSFHPQGRWLATGEQSGLSLWPLARRYPSVIRRHSRVHGLAFEPDGRWLASAGYGDGEVWLWPLDGDTPNPGRLLFEPDGLEAGLAVAPDGEHILIGSWFEGVRLLSLAQGVPRSFPGFEGQTVGVAFSSDGRLAAGLNDVVRSGGPVIRVWDVATEEEFAVLDPEEELFPVDLQFTSDGGLLAGSKSGLLRIDLETGKSEILYEGSIVRFDTSSDQRRVLMVEVENPLNTWGRVVLLELDTGAVTRLDGFGRGVLSVALVPEGDFAVTGDNDGEVRVGPLTGETPHLLLGHQNGIEQVAIDPLGRWIASGDMDGVIRLWPMPDLSKPPLHTLPREELITKLKTLTNLRVVRDEESGTGWKLTHDPFPGWETVPTW